MNAASTRLDGQPQGHAAAARLITRRPSADAQLVHTLSETAVPIAMHADASMVTVLWQTSPPSVADEKAGMVRQPSEPGPSLLTRFDARGQLLWSHRLELGAELLEVASDGSIGIAWPVTYASSSPTSMAVYDGQGKPRWEIVDRGVSSFAAAGDGNWWMFSASERVRAGHHGRDLSAPPVEQRVEIRSATGVLLRERSMCTPPCLTDEQLWPVDDPAGPSRMLLLGQMRAGSVASPSQSQSTAKFDRFTLGEVASDLSLHESYVLRASAARIIAADSRDTWVSLTCAAAPCSVATCDVGTTGETVVVRVDAGRSVTTSP
ncbi:MAG: hypothetical protein B7733_06065 [Myxococcales bacterium FL481]|nr:MAG: hypothetical protein B7733_06065 [Myxococcales bacterium FL481]